MEYLWVYVGLYHSHPNYAKHLIHNPSKDGIQTPFDIGPTKSNCAVPLRAQVENMDVQINGWLVLLKDENSINLKYEVNSTDPDSKF